MVSNRSIRPATRARTIIAWGAALLALAAAVGGSLASGSSGGALTLGVATLSGRLGASFQDMADAVPFGYAFAAGMASAVNPCGIALLPAYLGLYLGDSSSRPASASIGRALLVGTSMTAGFVVLFGVVGLALAVALLAVGQCVAWIGVLVGTALIFTGGRMLAGGSVYASGPDQLAARLGAGRRGGACSATPRTVSRSPSHPWGALCRSF